MISVEDALDRVLALVSPLEAEVVPLAEADGRVLAKAVAARRDQPPFAASAMDGYAVRAGDVAPGARLAVIGESAAGHGFLGTVEAGQAVRIFTGAPVPAGADRVVIQENVTREGDAIVIGEDPGRGDNIRPQGTDFKTGFAIEPPRRLGPSDVMLLAAMNVPEIAVFRQPSVALVATGDELVMPGDEPGADQIIASNSFALAAMARRLGARPRMLPIARDNETELRTVLELASDADLVVTIGGASVGDYDLVGKVAGDMGLDQSFYKVAMRPGKPLMAGTLHGKPMIGLPGNPVSSMVGGLVFMGAALRAMQGLPAGHPPLLAARLAEPLPKNGPRQHYMRARVEAGRITPFSRQDSSLMTVMAEANALLVRPPNDPERNVGDMVSFLEI